MLAVPLHREATVSSVRTTSEYLHSKVSKTVLTCVTPIRYENDVSPTRPDLYESGNNYITQADQFQDMINASPGGVVTLDSLASYRSQRFDTQVR